MANLNDTIINGNLNVNTINAENYNNIIISHATTSDMSFNSNNPSITFSEKGSQPVKLIYTDYDDYRAPAGLKVIGGTSASKAWFEVEGNIYENGIRLYSDNNPSKKIKVGSDTYTLTTATSGTGSAGIITFII